MKHTPGPWSAPSAGIYAGPIVNQQAQGPLIATTGSKEIIASMRKFGRDILTETEANAKLIAASPDLLAWAQDLLVLLDVEVESLPETEYKIYEEAYDKTLEGLAAAIAKATNA